MTFDPALGILICFVLSMPCLYYAGYAHGRSSVIRGRR